MIDDRGFQVALDATLARSKDEPQGSNCYVVPITSISVHTSGYLFSGKRPKYNVLVRRSYVNYEPKIAK